MGLFFQFDPSQLALFIFAFFYLFFWIVFFSIWSFIIGFLLIFLLNSFQSYSLIFYWFFIGKHKLFIFDIHRFIRILNKTLWYLVDFWFYKHHFYYIIK
jgi:hypothetical protein